MLINKKSVKLYALECSNRYRGGKFTRVGAEFFDEIDADLRRIVRRRVQSHPTLGKTLKGE